jgi:hypothetical protein
LLSPCFAFDFSPFDARSADNEPVKKTSNVDKKVNELGVGWGLFHRLINEEDAVDKSHDCKGKADCHNAAYEYDEACVLLFRRHVRTTL